MLSELFWQVYLKFKLHFYQEIFERFQDREASLTTVETFAMEAIQALDGPTINEFATFLKISPSNAAYKVNNLIKKGYLHKVRSDEDKREFHLQVSQKYMDYYDISNQYVSSVVDRIAVRFSPEECDQIKDFLAIISEELMSDVNIPPTLTNKI